MKITSPFGRHKYFEIRNGQYTLYARYLLRSCR